MHIKLELILCYYYNSSLTLSKSGSIFVLCINWFLFLWVSLSEATASGFREVWGKYLFIVIFFVVLLLLLFFIFKNVKK